MMMNPTMNRIEQLDNFQDSIQSTQAIDRLRAMQGLRGLPTVQMEKGQGIMAALQEKIMGSKEEESEDLEDILEKVREAKDDIPFYQLGYPFDLDEPGYLTDEIIEKMNEARKKGVRKDYLIDRDYEVDDIDKFIYKIRELPERRDDAVYAGNIKNLIDDIKARGKDKKYKKLLETLVRLRNPESAEEGEKQIDIENALAELYPDMIASEGKRVLPYIPGDVTQDRYGVRSVRGNLPSILVDRKEGGSIADTAQDLASYGRFGDSVLMHVRPDELQGLMSLGNITYNPITGLPEAFSLKSITRPFRNIAKSKAFKVIAPLAISLVAPAALSGVMGGYAGLGGAAKYGLASAIGSGLGSLVAGRKPADALKSAAFTGLTAGTLKGISNYMTDSQLARELAAKESTMAAREAAAKTAGGETLTASLTETGTLPKSGIPTVEQFKGANIDIEPVKFSNLPKEDITRFKNLASEAAQKEALGLSQQSFGDRLSSEFLATRPGTVVGQGDTAFIKPGGIDVLGTAGKIAPKALLADVGGSYLALEDAEESQKKAAEEQLAAMDYEIDTGFGGQTVIRDPEGVVLPAYLSSQDILNIALGKAPRPRLVPGTQFAPTREVVTAAESTKGETIGGIGDLPPRVEETITQMENDMMDDVFEMKDEEFEEKYNTSKDEAYQFIKDQTGMTDGDFNELFSGRALQPIKKEQGGLINLAAGGEFSGMVPGQGGGMDDNVFMPIKEGNKQVGTLAVSPTEYVVDSYTMAALGDGNPSEGAKVMDGVVKRVRQKAYGTMKQPNEIDGLQALRPMMEGV
jgi:hypothetical protein